MALQPISTPEGARKLLQRLLDANRCRLEDLDTPPPGRLGVGTYRNLLREEPLEPRVEVTAPRDFVPPAAAPAEEDWI